MTYRSPCWHCQRLTPVVDGDCLECGAPRDQQQECAFCASGESYLHNFEAMP